MIGFQNNPARYKIYKLGIVFCCLALGVFLRLSNRGFVLAPLTGHFNFIDTDCYYYLRRLVHFLENFPAVMVFDPLLDWPTGGTVDWPEGFLIVLGIPLKIFGVHNFEGLEMGVTILMITLGLVACASIYSAAGRVLKEFYLRAFVLFFAVCNFLLVRFSCFGQVDHHIMEALFPPIVFILSLDAFQNHRRYAAITLGFLLTYSLSISSSSIFVITAFFCVYGFILGAKENFKNFFYLMGAFLVSLVPYALWSIARKGNPTADNYPSYFHISLVLVLGASSFAMAKFRKKAFFVLPALLVLGAGCYFLSWPRVLVHPLEAAFSYVFGKSGVLQNVSEAFPLYGSFNGLSLAFMHINFGFLIYLLPTAWFLNFFPKYFTPAERVLFLILSVISVPGIAQKRFSHLMVGLYLVFIVWILSRLIVFVRKMEFRVEIPLLISWAALTLIPVIDANFSPHGSARDIVDLGTSKAFLSKVQISQEEAWNRLAGKVSVTEGIWANPNMGHMLMYYTGLGTVANSFYHHQSFSYEFKLRTIESQEELKRELTTNGIRYMILADDWQFFELEFKLRGLPFSKFMERQMVQGKMSSVFSMPELMKLAWARMLLGDQAFDGFDRLFSVQFRENHYYNYLRGYRFNY